MDVRSIGLVRPISEIEPGECVIFSYSATAQVGMIVEYGKDAKGILHIDARRDDAATPTIYSIDHFYDESAVHVTGARIVPVMAPEHVGFGRHSSGVISPVLYLTHDAAFIVALSGGHHIVAVNVFTGKVTSSGDMSRVVHTKAWYLEVTDGNGMYEPFHEVRCE